MVLKRSGRCTTVLATSSTVSPRRKTEQANCACSVDSPECLYVYCWLCCCLLRPEFGVAGRFKPRDRVEMNERRLLISWRSDVINKPGFTPLLAYTFRHCPREPAKVCTARVPVFK